MTYAQYYRSLAAQVQSKVGDQWSFFQAKRIRGTSMEMTAAMLHAPAEPGGLEPALLQASAERLVAGLRRAEKEADRLTKALGSAKASLGAGGAALPRAAEQLLRTAREKTEVAEALQWSLAGLLAEVEVQKNFKYLNRDQMPAVEDQHWDDPQIRQVLQAIGAREPESAVEKLVAPISGDRLDEAIAVSEANAQAFDVVAKAVNESLQPITKVVDEGVALVRSFRRAAREVEAAAAELPAGDSKDLAEVRSAVAAVAGTAGYLRAVAEELDNDFKGAWYGFNARRYERDARYNQATAGLFEVLVRKNSLLSERHRTRSKHFFYGMLLAQAGVTISSLALAVRKRSVLWSLAGLAGLAAMIFGAYVYVYR
jgi:hypothetical protein